jgi:hypothetical protein
MPTFPSMRDPRLIDLATHIKILDAKLNTNLSSIDDFKFLLLESKKELISNKDILMTINAIDDALSEAKASMLNITAKRNQAKEMMEHADQQLSTRLSRSTPGKNSKNTKSSGSRITSPGAYLENQSNSQGGS